MEETNRVISFDVKMDLTVKILWLIYGHRKHDKIGSTYAGLVSIEIARTEFTHDEFNTIDIFDY